MSPDKPIVVALLRRDSSHKVWSDNGSNLAIHRVKTAHDLMPQVRMRQRERIRDNSSEQTSAETVETCGLRDGQRCRVGSAVAVARRLLDLDCGFTDRHPAGYAGTGGRCAGLSRGA